MKAPRSVKVRFNVIYWALICMQIGAIILCETLFKETSKVDEFLYWPILIASILFLIISMVFRKISKSIKLMKQWYEFPLKNFKKLHDRRRANLEMSEEDYNILIASDQILVVILISWVFAEKITVLAVALSFLFGASKITLGIIIFSILLNLFNRVDWDDFDRFLKKVMEIDKE